MSALLNNSGFVFLDERPWPYLVRKGLSNNWWLYYWRDSTKQFAMMREITCDEMSAFRERAISPEQAALYLPQKESGVAK